MRKAGRPCLVVGELSTGWFLERSSQLGYVVHNHGDRFRPQFLGLWDPFQMAFHSMAYINGGDPHFLRYLG